MDKFFNMIGLATKAGKVKTGAFLTEKAVKSGNACLVIVATDASERTGHDMEHMCAYYEVPLIRYGSSDELGHFTGHESRTVLAVTDEGLAGAMIKINNSKSC